MQFSFACCEPFPAPHFTDLSANCDDGSYSLVLNCGDAFKFIRFKVECEEDHDEEVLQAAVDKDATTSSGTDWRLRRGSGESESKTTSSID